MAEKLSRGTSFSYRCNGCGRCCHDKTIQVNPYEIARLSRNRKLGTREFIERHLSEDGPYLKSKYNGACEFLGSGGCEVYEDRPLVCRLYPLGREVTPDGKEFFFEVPPHPLTRGEYGTKGAVRDFLDKQETKLFVEAADRYHAMVNDLLLEISEGSVEGKKAPVMDWLDLDTMLAQSDEDIAGLSLEQRVALHVASIKESADTLKKEGEEHGE